MLLSIVDDAGSQHVGTVVRKTVMTSQHINILGVNSKSHQLYGPRIITEFVSSYHSYVTYFDFLKFFTGSCGWSGAQPDGRCVCLC